MLPDFYPEAEVLLLRQKDPKQFATSVFLRIPFDAHLIQRLRNSHGSNSARLFLDWTPHLGHAESD